VSEDVRTITVITAAGAAGVLAAALRAASASGVPSSIAVTDPAGELMTFHRMDGAPRLTIELAIAKADTATKFGVPSQQWFELIKDDPALLTGIPHLPGLVVFGGGVPLRVDGVMVGAIGVSGGSVDQDIAVAEAGSAALSP